MSIHGGVYAIASSIGQEQLATAQTGDHAVVIVLPPVGQPGIQEWVLERQSNANYTIRNLKTNKYLSYEGDAKLGKAVQTEDKPREWRLQQSNEPFKFHVVVPGGPIDGHELAFDLARLTIFPPQTALAPLDINNPQQAWRFSFHK